MAKLLIFIVAYNAQRHIESVLSRIPAHYFGDDCEILLIDDASKDATVERAHAWARAHQRSLKLFRNPINQGYGGNQKLGYRYAIEQGFDAVALLHGDGQYAPERLDAMFAPLLQKEADLVIGSRMLRHRDALKGGMPFYKFVGNIVVSGLQNRLLHSRLSEFHSGYRAWSVAALARIPFDYNSPDFDFDTEILIQSLDNRFRISEIPIPTHYGDEICHVNGVKYCAQILRTTITSRLQKFGIRYTPKYDYAAGGDACIYKLKSDFSSTHSYALALASEGQTVLDLGCGSGALAAEAQQKGCAVIGMDKSTPELHRSAFASFTQQDLDMLTLEDLPASDAVDIIWLLDVIEHVSCPEALLRTLRQRYGETQTRIVINTPNIAFIIMRLSLLFGQFNYGPRGILDMTHRRLFTYATLRSLLKSQGYVIEDIRGVPAPFGLVANGKLARFLLRVNQALIACSRSLFAYEIAMVARPLPTTRHLLALSEATAHTRLSGL